MIASGACTQVRYSQRRSRAKTFIGAEPDADSPPRAREAHDQVPVRPLRGRADEPVVVRVAADDPMHDDRVRLVREGGGLHDVAETAVDALLEPALARQRGRLLLVLRRELEVRRPGRAGLEELDLDRTDAAADLDDGPPSMPRSRRKRTIVAAVSSRPSLR